MISSNSGAGSKQQQSSRDYSILVVIEKDKVNNGHIFETHKKGKDLFLVIKLSSSLKQQLVL